MYIYIGSAYFLHLMYTTWDWDKTVLIAVLRSSSRPVYDLSFCKIRVWPVTLKRTFAWFCISQDSKRSRDPGYGFVNFTTPEEAYQAIQATNNMQFGPCVLTVRLANSSKGSGKGLPPGGSMGMSLGGFDGCPPSASWRCCQLLAPLE
jgi:hypothetical protein